jgi:hypothetical protein
MNKDNFTMIIKTYSTSQSHLNPLIKKHYFYKFKLQREKIFNTEAFHYYHLKMKMELECFKMILLKDNVIM